MVISCIVFLLYFLYDINDVYFHYRILQKFFMLGSLLLVVKTLSILFSYPIHFIWLIGALLFLVLLVYTLFFALPFEDTYVNPSQGRTVYSKGIYGVCRHPGFWWFLGLYVCLGLASGHIMMTFGLFSSFLNFLYIVFQDRVTFPKVFVDYLDYKKRVPFLIPGGKRHAISG